MSIVDGAHIVITGASSGIGAALARQLGGRAAKLSLVARRKERLEALKKELETQHRALEVSVVPCDLSDRAATRALADRLGAGGPVDVLVNNAGVGDMGMFDQADLDKQLMMLELNVASLVVLTHAVLPAMIERGRGAVLNVSSAFGLSYLPGFAGYIGTKHFVTGFTEGLRADCFGTGVSISQLCPGPVETEFENHVGNFTGEKVPGFISISAARCARAGVLALDGRRAMVIPGLLMKLVVLIRRWSPEFLVRWVVAPVGRVLRRRQERALEAAR